MPFLDKNGLGVLWGNITSKFATKEELSNIDVQDEIYIGTGNIPAGYTLQINPSGDNIFPTTMLDIDVTIPASAWSNNTATVSAPGLLNTDRPIADIVQTGNEETDAAIRRAWNLITRMVASANTITAYAEKAPGVNIPLQLKVVR